MHGVTFTVKGLPPRKNGANSVWSKKNPDGKRLEKLREAATKAMDGHAPFTSQIYLRFDVRVTKVDAGDLDTFVAGVCDGLQGKPKSMSEDKLPEKLRGNCGPIAFEDDSAVMSICASKTIVSGAGKESYTVTVGV